MRTIVSVYLIVTGGLVGAAIVVAGLFPGHISLAPYLVGGSGVGAFFVIATVLMWTRVRGNWLAAAAAAFIGGGAWWLLAYAVLAQPHRPPLASAIIFIVMTAVVTLGVLCATLQRAPEKA
jgi:hypothetical protein